MKLIADVRLARADGIELVNEIRGLRPGLPALIMSGDTSGARIRELANADLLQKPFTPGQLSDRVDRALLRQA